MDAAEIGFEMVGGGPGSAITMLRNVAGRGKYTMGPDEAPVTFEQMVKIIEETDDATFAGMKLKIKGDEVLKGMAEGRKDKLRQKKAKIEQLGEDLDNLSVEDAEAAIELETELDKVSGGLTRAKKNRKKDIEAKLDEIYSRRQEPGITDVEADELATQDSDSVKKETYETVDDDGETTIVVFVTAKDGSRKVIYKTAEGTTYSTQKFGKDNTLTNEEIVGLSLAGYEGADIINTETVEGFENIANKNAAERRKQELLKQKQDAIQESSAAEVDVQEQTPDGQPVGDGDSEGGITVEGEGETEGATEATQEEIEQGAADLEDLLSGLTDSPVNLGDGTRGRNSTPDREEIEAQQDLVDELQEDSREAQAVWESTADPREIINNQIKGIVDPDTAKINEELAKAEEKLKELKGRQNVGEVTVNENLTVVDQTETDSHYGSENFRRETLMRLLSNMKRC
jgi:hypothetical protein